MHRAGPGSWRLTGLRSAEGRSWGARRSWSAKSTWAVATLRTGYVEAVATAPASQGSGIGSAVMTAAGAFIAGGFEFGLLATGAIHFYERLGWRAWAGPSSVRLPGEGRSRPRTRMGTSSGSPRPRPPVGFPPTRRHRSRALGDPATRGEPGSWLTLRLPPSLCHQVTQAMEWHRCRRWATPGSPRPGSPRDGGQRTTARAASQPVPPDGPGHGMAQEPTASREGGRRPGGDAGRGSAGGAATADGAWLAPQAAARTTRGA